MSELTRVATLAIFLASYTVFAFGKFPGNPQNMLIGSFSGIRYRDFMWHLGPVAAAGLLLDWLVIWMLFARTSGSDLVADMKATAPHVDRARLVKPVLVTTGVLIGFSTLASSRCSRPHSRTS